jgi:hypothetical protein
MGAYASTVREQTYNFHIIRKASGSEGLELPLDRREALATPRAVIDCGCFYSVNHT